MLGAAWLLVGLPCLTAHPVFSCLMKQAGFALPGVITATALVWGGVFAAGSALEALGLRLYQSEADQQRNFNLVLLAWVLVTILCGWLGWRWGRQR